MKNEVKEAKRIRIHRDLWQAAISIARFTNICDAKNWKREKENVLDRDFRKGQSFLWFQLKIYENKGISVILEQK